MNVSRRDSTADRVEQEHREPPQPERLEVTLVLTRVLEAVEVWRGETSDRVRQQSQPGAASLVLVP